ncbi:3-hydroxyacyl-CoA dehydrogenase [Pseudomonas chlororaphis]|uniref:3-hydroxyacyl-CoA dehydrogenase n=1 Tax=Pseudomonas chlororaphis TaxID=587753 RepID=A0AB34CAS8_9PSED|nr:3-hydroxyacyl-CoA dehydrogenase [Pseudomonas chlororaphis]KAA5844916.1 3-hydroxyacyl-CoA dehydrogenase [Pseudomonas chlororaphis]
MTTQPLQRIGLVGTGAMGRGIAQVMAMAGLKVFLFDARPGAAGMAREQLATIFAQQIEKARITPQDAAAAMLNLEVVDSLQALHDCQLVIEAIVEDLAAKQQLFRQLEEVLAPDAILASNTSSLSITAIASVCRYPERVAGLHFFNPVPRMRIVEVIDGLATRVGARLQELVRVIGYYPARAKDSPGFIVNHAGRAFGTEALRILSEGVAPAWRIDALLRDSAGFAMGPFELLDLIGLDVSVPVMESVYRQFYEEPRYRPHPVLRLMLAGGHLGRKSGQGFYLYDEPGDTRRPPQAVPSCAVLPPVWIAADDEVGRLRLLDLLERLGARVENGLRPSTSALCLVAPLGDDASEAALRHAMDPSRTVAIDTLTALDSQRCLMLNPATREDMQHAAHALFSADGGTVTLIRDSCGFIVQRTLASIVNLACDIAQQDIASVADIDAAVRLGLGYPLGPLEWGDQLGPERLLQILERLHALTGDPRYRPSGWLRRRALLGLSLRQPENPLPA